MFLKQYFSIFLFFCLGSALSSVILFASMALCSAKTNDSQKVSSYECGFNPFIGNPQQQQFNIQYFVIAILFLIFDLEVVFLYPLISCIGISTSSILYTSTMWFLLILGVGLVFEWKAGALEWV